MPFYQVRDALEFMRERFGFTPHPPIERGVSSSSGSGSGQTRTTHFMDPRGSSSEETPLTPQIVAQSIQDFLANILKDSLLHRLSKENGGCFSFPKSQKVFPSKEVHHLPRTLEELSWFLNYAQEKVHASNSGIPGVGAVSEVSMTRAMECDGAAEVVSDDPEVTLEIPPNESVAESADTLRQYRIQFVGCGRVLHDIVLGLPENPSPGLRGLQGLEALNFMFQYLPQESYFLSLREFYEHLQGEGVDISGYSLEGVQVEVEDITECSLPGNSGGGVMVVRTRNKLASPGSSADYRINCEYHDSLGYSDPMTRLSYGSISNKLVDHRFMKYPIVSNEVDPMLQNMEGFMPECCWLNAILNLVNNSMQRRKKKFTRESLWSMMGLSGNFDPIAARRGFSIQHMVPIFDYFDRAVVIYDALGRIVYERQRSPERGMNSIRPESWGFFMTEGHIFTLTNLPTHFRLTNLFKNAPRYKGKGNVLSTGAPKKRISSRLPKYETKAPWSLEALRRDLNPSAQCHRSKKCKIKKETTVKCVVLAPAASAASAASAGRAEPPSGPSEPFEPFEPSELTQI